MTARRSSLEAYGDRVSQVAGLRQVRGEDADAVGQAAVVDPDALGEQPHPSGSPHLPGLAHGVRPSGLTQRELGDRLGCSEDLVSSLERGRRTPQREFLEAADELLDAGGLLRTTIEDVERAEAKARVRHPAWFRDYARLEREAVEINDYN